MLDIFDNSHSEIDRISEVIDNDLNAIADAQGTNAKKAQLALINKPTFTALRLHLDPFVKFGVSQFKSGGTGEGLHWDTVFTMLTEGKGRDLAKIADRMSPLQFKIINGIFDGFKKWKLGVKSRAFLDCFPGSFQTFAVQLSNTWNPDDFEPGSYAQTKYDGIRCVAAVNHNGEVHFLSRNGKPVEQIEPWVEAELSKYPGYVFDSETYSAGVHFQKVSGIAKRKNSDEKLVLKFFDMIPYDAFFERKYDVPYEQRYADLGNKLSGSTLESLIAPHTQVWSIEEAEEFYQTQRANGEEGALVKKADGIYSFDRDDSWMKVKPLTTEECRITEFHEGTRDTKHVGSLGAITVTDRFGKKSRVGSGFSDDLRKWIWENRDDLQDALCEIKFMERTESGAFRHSRFHKLRLDKDDMNPTGA